MKTLKAKDLRDLSKEDLERKLLDFRRELMELKFKRAAKQIKNPLHLRFLKRGIAKILTIFKEREIKGGS